MSDQWGDGNQPWDPAQGDPTQQNEPPNPFGAPPTPPGPPSFGAPPPPPPPPGPQWGQGGGSYPPPPPAAPGQAWSQPGYPQPAAMPYGSPIGTKPNSNLVWAILSTLFCCLPFGVVAIVFAAKVDSQWTQGDQAGAERSSRLARNWSIASAGISIVIIVLYLVAALALGAFDTSSY